MTPFSRISRHRPRHSLAGLLALVLVVGPATSRAADDTAPPLPALDGILRRALERGREEERNSRDFKAHYAFTRIKTTAEYNSHGRQTRHEVKRREHEPAAPPAAAGSMSRPGEADPDLQGRKRAFDRSDFVLDDELLGRFEFTLAGRDELDGRPALVLDFRPAARRLPVRSLKDRFINKSAGRAWVDEEDFTIARAVVRLIEPVHVIGGLVGTVRQCEVTLERRRTPEGHWYPIRTKWHLEGRQFLANKTLRFEESREDVRKVW